MAMKWLPCITNLLINSPKKASGFNSFLHIPSKITLSAYWVCINSLQTVEQCWNWDLKQRKTSLDFTVGEHREQKKILRWLAKEPVGKNLTIHRIKKRKIQIILFLLKSWKKFVWEKLRQSWYIYSNDWPLTRNRLDTEIGATSQVSPKYERA